MREISLNASMRSNLLSLQQTQMLQDMTQLRLSTGLKVNSAVDNPSSYYTASSLNNRAKDLSQLLDAMGQGIQTIKTASETLMTATKFLEQAKAVATKASEASFDIVAKVRNEQELLDAIDNGGPGYIVITSDISLTNEIKLKDGQKLVGDNYFAEYNGANRKLSFDFTGRNGDGIQLANNSQISNLTIDYIGDAEIAQNGVISIKNAKNAKISNINISLQIQPLLDIKGNTISGILINDNSSVVIEGNVNIKNSGKLSSAIYNFSNSDLLIKNSRLNIKTIGENTYGLVSGKNGENLNVNIRDSEINIDSSYACISAYNTVMDISNSKVNIVTQRYAITNGNKSTLNLNNSIFNVRTDSYGLYNISGITNISNNTVLNFEIGSNKVNSLGLFLQSVDEASIVNLDGTSRINIKTFVPTQNAIRTYVNPVTGAEAVINIQKGGVININKNDALTDALYAFTKDFSQKEDTKGVSSYINSFQPTDASIKAKENVIINIPVMDIDNDQKQIFSGTAEAKSYQDGSQYQEILSQYDMLISDASYKGINLLEGASLKVNFNKERSSQIEVKVVDASAKGLGLQGKTWESKMDILRSVDELNQSINKIRAISSQFGNYYSIVSSRQDFTENLINVLTEGSDKLTLADMNEESANILALKTRQQLAINSLSLASQATQSVLGLF